MSLSLHEKQFLHSIIELIVKNRNLAQDVLQHAQNRNGEYSKTLQKILPILETLEEINKEDIENDYSFLLSSAADSIVDSEVKAVVKSTIKSSGLPSRQKAIHT
ncbi:hypothetical protein [Pseudoalteromonas phenolica]|uniref:hypothetical protein n=1 Tax=Pseudoalteromonas phenolica TaxID=161398 RepID=UPI00384BA6B2